MSIVALSFLNAESDLLRAAEICLTFGSTNCWTLVLEDAREKHINLDIRYFLEKAAKIGKIDCLKFLVTPELKKDSVLIHDLIIIAIQGNIDKSKLLVNPKQYQLIVKYLVEELHADVNAVNPRILAELYLYGNHDIIKYFLEHGYTKVSEIVAEVESLKAEEKSEEYIESFE